MDALFDQVLIAVLMGVIGAVVFAAIGLISGSDETTTLAPLTLLVVLLGVPAAGVFTFFLAGAVAKHMTHAVPTALLGIPGDTMATPLMREANFLRNLGVPHIALRKMISGAVIAALVAVPLAVLFAVLLAPFGDAIKQAAPWVFLAAATTIAYFSAGRWASVLALLPFVLVIIALQTLTGQHGVKLSVSYFLGIAIGPLIAALFAMLAPAERARMKRSERRTFALSPDVKGWGGWFPNPLKVLDRRQAGWTLATATVSSATFVFSPVAMTVILGEVVGSLSASEFLAYGMLAVVIAILIAYPFSMNFAHRAASFVSRRISHEAVIATFVGLILVIGLWEGGLLGLLVILTVGLLGGFLYRFIGFNIGVQFMGYYTAVLSVPAIVALFG